VIDPALFEDLDWLTEKLQPQGVITMSTTGEITSTVNTIPAASSPADYHERLEQAVEAAVMEPFARWEIKDMPPPAIKPPRPYRSFRLKLDGGLWIHMDDQFHTVIPVLYLSVGNSWFTHYETIEECASDLPAKLLPVLKAAVADLEKIIPNSKGG